MVAQLNDLINGPSLFDVTRFATVRLSEETKQTLASTRRNSPTIRLNHLLLVDAYPKELTKTPLFDAPRTKEQFEPPAILIRLLNTLPMSFREDYLTYRDDVVGIKAPPNQTEELKDLHRDLRRLKAIHLFFLYATAPQLFVGKATVPQKFDLDRLPLLTANEIDEPLFSDADNAVIKDVVESFGDFVRLGQESALLLKEADDAALSKFTEQYLELINSMYGKFRAGSVIKTSAYTCIHFSYGGPPEAELKADEPLEQAIERLLLRENSAVRVQRILRLYAGNTIYLIKPNRLRYWIPSVAVRDADETVADLATRDAFPKTPHRKKK